VFLAFQILVTYSLVSATAKNHHKNENIPLQSVSMASEGGSEKITDEKIFHNNCDKHSANDDSKNVKDQSKKFKNIAKYSCLGILAFFTIYFVNEKNKKNEKHYHEHDILEKSQQWFANFKKKNLK
jgi:hypothetical protein